MEVRKLMEKVKDTNNNLTAKYFMKQFDLIIMQRNKKKSIFVIESLIIV